MVSRRGLLVAGLVVALPVGLAAARSERPVGAGGTAGAAGFLASSGVPVTAGAAGGYVPDAVCGECHTEIARSYAAVGMARAFSRPRRATAVERFDEVLVHEASGQRFTMTWRGEELWFRRWLVDAAGAPVLQLEQRVDWVLGSGNRARTYLFRTPSGELWQLPVNWYTQESVWGMAPGFDRADHEGVLRPVQRECMVCHDAFPELPEGADRFGMPHRFPAALPEGIGCQRCHGPGAEHVRRLRDPAADFESAAAAIVNPRKLSPELARAVCEQCHLQPSVALPAVRRFERGDLAFRPGDTVSTHRVELEAVEEGRPPGDRFEINHHAYRLGQSRCATASGGALSCLTCHDPHRKVAPERRAAHYRAACLGCHREDALSPAAHPRRDAAPAVAPLATAEPATAAPAPAAGGAAARTCVDCHMPQRRAEDVVHAVMTDHRIARGPFGPETTAPRAESDPVLIEARFLRPAEAPAGAEGEVYRAVGVLRIGGRDSALPYLERLLRGDAAGAAAGPATPAAARAPGAAGQAEPWLRLAEAHLLERRYGDAERAIDRALALQSPTATLRVWQGLAAAGQGRREDALGRLRAAVALDPLLVEGWFDLGGLLLAWGDAAGAVAPLERAVALRPNLPAGWLRLGEAREALGRRDAALADYRQALAVDPGLPAAHVALARALLAAGDRPAAEAAFALGERVARRPDEVARARAAAFAPPSH